MSQFAEFPTLMDDKFDEFCKSYPKKTAAAAKELNELGSSSL